LLLKNESLFLSTDALDGCMLTPQYWFKLVVKGGSGGGGIFGIWQFAFGF
jgi:hypothetical protein